MLLALKAVFLYRFLRHNCCVVIAVTLTCNLLACRSTTHDDTLNFYDGDDSTIHLDLDSDDPSAIPGFLWSPSQRKSNASFHYVVAEYQELSGNLPEAMRSYQLAYSLDPNPFLASKLIAAQATLGQISDALPEAKRMVLLYPRSSQLRRLHGRLLTMVGQYEQAVDEFELALQLEDGSEEIYLELIDLHTQVRRHDRALVLTTELLRSFPHSVGGWARLAQIHLATGDKEKALLPAKKAYEMQPSNPELVLIYALTLDMNQQSRKAIGLYEQLYRMNPSNQELIDRMIEMYRQVGDIEEALGLLQELSAQPEGNTPGVQMQQAILLWELERFAEAAVILEQLSEEFADSERLQYMHGLGQERMNNFARALEAYERIPASSTLRTQGDFRRMVIFRQQEAIEESDELALRLLEQKDVPWETYAIAASNREDLGDLEKAKTILQQGYKQFPEQIHLLFMLGAYQEKAGDWDASVETMRKVIEADKSHSMALNFLGYMYAEKGVNLEEAEELIRRAIELKPDDGYFLDSLGWVYFQRGDYDKALPTLKRASELAPGEGVIYEHIADTYEALGKEDEAFEYMRRASESKLEERDAPRIKEKFEKMKQQRGLTH